MIKALTKLTRFSFIAFLTVSLCAEYKLGRDYVLVDNPLPVKKDGIVEVTESFWYGCAHCYSFEPAINSWIETLKLDPSTHSAVFVTIHKEGNFLQNPKAIKEFLEKFGVAPEVTEQYLNSFSVKQKVNRGIKYAKQLKISAVPMIIVDGTYVIQSRGSFSDMLKVVDHVIELQRPNS